MLRNVFGHLYTVHRHRMLVMKMCFRCRMYSQGLRHDLSKYSYTELSNSIRYYLGYRSPVGNERKHKGYSEIYLHHTGRNKHHPEYWYDPFDPRGRISMPDRYILESVIDRIAAAKIYLKNNYNDASPLEYYLNDGLTENLLIEERDKYSYLLNYLKDNGEDNLLKKIREMYERGYILKN